MLDLKDGGCEDICLHCYKTRKQCIHGEDAPRFPRLLFTFEEAGRRKLRDHKGRPVLAGKDIWSIHYCIMHGTIPFGKNILTYFWERCYWADTLEQAQAKLRVADKFMRKHNIKVYNTLAGFAHTL